MYNPKDIQFEGKHDFVPFQITDRRANWAQTVSVGIYQLVLRNNGKSLKASKILVRVYGSPDRLEEINNKAEEIVKLMDSGEYTGTKTVVL